VLSKSPHACAPRLAAPVDQLLLNKTTPSRQSLSNLLVLRVEHAVLLGERGRQNCHGTRKLAVGNATTLGTLDQVRKHSLFAWGLT
jgi:hypothetical protein